MRTRTLTAFLVAGAVALAGCGDHSNLPLGVVVGNAPEEGPDGGGLFVQVSDTTGTTTPVYDWTGNARELIVVRVSDGFPMWRLEATDLDAGFDAPVQHGVTPAAARQTAGSRLLSPDVRYSVRIVSVDGVRGSTTYTP